MIIAQKKKKKNGNSIVANADQIRSRKEYDEKGEQLFINDPSYNLAD